MDTYTKEELATILENLGYDFNLDDFDTAALNEGYSFLSEAGPEFMAAYNNGGKDLDSYINKRAGHWVSKGLSSDEANKKATKDYETRAHNIYIHTGKSWHPNTEDKSRNEKAYPAQVKKY